MEDQIRQPARAERHTQVPEVLNGEVKTGDGNLLAGHLLKRGAFGGMWVLGCTLDGLIF